MKNLNINVVTLAVGLALCAPSMAAELSAAEYAAAEKAISTDFTTAKAECATMSGNASEICMAIAHGKESIAKADLEVRNESTAETRLQALIVRAEADFAEAKERCDDKATASMTACLQTAQIAETAAKAKANKEHEMEMAATKIQATPKTTASLGKNEMRATDTLFDFDSSALRPAGRDSLDNFVAKLKTDSSAEVTIVGYTDRLGTTAYNQQLSERRMEAVKSYLIEEGIQTSRISAEAMGQAEPTMSANDCSGERSAAVIACLQPDRRVVVSTAKLVSSN